MGKVASGKERIDVIHKKQSNGTIYVYERTSYYDPARKFYVPKGTKIIGKILPGTTEVIQTRPKAPNGTRKKAAVTKTTSPGGVQASRVRYGASAILKHIGKSSGIDDDVYQCCDEGTAKKIIALARYYLQTDGAPTSHIEKWQLTHIAEPYEYPISEDTAHNLFVQVGIDEALRQTLFVCRAKKIDKNSVIAYDATTVSTYVKNHVRSRYGYDKDKEGLESDKLFTFYSMTSRQPICYSTVPGDIPDVIGLNNSLKQLKVIGLNNIEMVADAGFYSEDNLSLLFKGKYNFITRVRKDIKWIRSEVDKAIVELEDHANLCPFEDGTYGISVSFMHTFEKVRKYGNQAKGLTAGDTETFSRRVRLHIFVNENIKIKENNELDKILNKIRKEYESGIREFSQSAQKIIDKFMIIKSKRNGGVSITFNTKAIKEEKKYNGIFVLVADKEKGTFEALKKFRQREWIEDFFEEYKRRVGSKKYRTWTDESTDGEKLIKFISLCYYEYLSKEIRKLKETLGKENGDHNHDLKSNLDKEKKLRIWLENTSIHEILEWFDAVEKTEVLTHYGKEQWTTEIIERDKLLLNKLGIEIQ